jgi:hypothetical protein
MICSRLLKIALISGTVVFGVAQICLAQDTSGDKSWTSSSQQQDPAGALNPTRTRETHTESGGRVIDKTSVEALGPDGRYIPYSDTEKESVRVNATTVRNIERTFGRSSDGQRTLVQERQEESRSLPGGEQKVVRTVSNPDANGALQVVQRELKDSKQLSPGVRETKTTVFSPDTNGGLAPAVQIEEREKQGGDGAVEFKKSTLLSDGAGHWQLSEIREGTTKKEDGQVRTKEERVLRPDSDGKMAIVERTVSRQTDVGSGEKHDTIETYSTNVPGKAGDDSLQLVERETQIQRNATSGEQRITRLIEKPSPGGSNDFLHVTEETIDIVRPGGSGVADEKQVILNADSDGNLHQVWIDVGKTSNPAAVQVDTSTPAKPQ